MAQCFMCPNHHKTDAPFCSTRCEQKHQKLTRMIGLVYWLNRNRRGWGRVQPVEVLTGGLLRVEDLEDGDYYPVTPSDLKREWALTNKQRKDIGLAIG